MTDELPVLVTWLESLAAQGGKGTVNNIDARALGRVAAELESFRAENARLSEALVAVWDGLDLAFPAICEIGKTALFDDIMNRYADVVREARVTGG